ncbi:MAG: elongation factor G, partial [Alphaproteobacteria bacterium]|nr:elongation factor G [Alphaproteobacteria bacterium]
IEPPRDEVFADLTSDLRNGSVTPVLIGAAENGNGVLRLLKTIRHDAPGIPETCQRIGLNGANATVTQVIKTIHTAHGGKLSVARVLSGSLKDGDELYGADENAMRVSGLYRLVGHEQTKLGDAATGETVALGKLEDAHTGDVLSTTKGTRTEIVPTTPPAPVYSIAL